MANFLVKALYATLGTGLACSVPAGLCFGLGKSLAANSSIGNVITNPENQQVSISSTDSRETSGTVMNVSCGRDGKQFKMESLSGINMGEKELQELFQSEMDDEDCSNLEAS